MKICVYGSSPLKASFEKFLEARDPHTHDAAVFFADPSAENNADTLAKLSEKHERLLAVCDYFAAEGEDPKIASTLGALSGAVKALARSKKKLRINLLRHGATLEAELSDCVALGRCAAPEEIFEPILFFVGEGCDFMTGQTIDVNGGIIY